MKDSFDISDKQLVMQLIKQEYYRAIENMDIAVGRIIDYLKYHNLLENTIVIFTSDNGSRWDHSNDPLHGEKCFNLGLKWLTKGVTGIQRIKLNH